MQDRFKVDTYVGLTGLNHENRIFPFLLTRESVYFSVEKFVSHLKTTGQLHEFLPLRGRSFSSNEDMGLFVYEGVIPTVSSPPLDYFHYDADISLVLYSGDPKEGNAVCVGFSILERDDPEWYEARGFFPGALKPGDIMIEQLQTSKKGFRGVASTHGFDPQTFPYRWEIGLTKLISSWASYAGFPRILFSPAENSRYFGSYFRVRETHRIFTKEEMEKRFTSEEIAVRNRVIKRNNFTAEQCGFTRSELGQPYILNLLPVIQFEQV